MVWMQQVVECSKWWSAAWPGVTNSVTDVCAASSGPVAVFITIAGRMPPIAAPGPPILHTFKPVMVHLRPCKK
jgi:hypothetical protein